MAHIVRDCNDAQIIHSGSKSYHIPPGSRVTILFAGIHLQEQIWGNDVTEFRPARWPIPKNNGLNKDNTENLKIPSLTLQPPVKGAFLPWSGGPRICPGMKMAQVEFLAVIFTLFSKYRVEAMPKSGESLEDAREKLRSVIMDSFPRLTLQMNHPKNAALRWSSRQEYN